MAKKITYVIGPNGKRVSLKDRTMRRSIHGRKGDKIMKNKDAWHNKYMLKSN